jgi:hypothetical protein
MTTDAKTQTNRENSQHSTGPKSETGKARSAQNARIHGLSAKFLHLPAHREEEFKSLFQAHFDEIRPFGELQSQYFEQLIHAAWHAILAREFLAAAYRSEDERKILNFTRLLHQHERAYARAHKAITQLQTDLALRAIEQNEPIAHLPHTVEVKRITNEANLHARLAAQSDPVDPISTRALTRRTVLEAIGQAFRPLDVDSNALPIAA